MKILVCDDLPNRGEETKRAIEDSGVDHEPLVVPVPDFEAAIKSLVAHSRRFLSGDGDIGASCADPLFDDSGIGIVILDNNLTELNIGGARHTAEALAGLIRAFTDIPYIVSLNKNPETDFDLRYLVGDYQTAADLALNLRHLANTGLWAGARSQASEAFLPWYWPMLDEASVRRRSQESLVERCLDQQVLEALDFDVESVAHLSRHAKGALGPEAEDDTALGTVTFLELFRTTGRSLPIQSEREAIAEACRGPEEDPMRGAARKVASRVVAAEIDRWFRRDVVGPQSVLVDVPHLLMRMPFLLGEGAAVLERWNNAVATDEPPFGLAGETYQRFVDGARYGQQVWTGRACFWWPRLDADAELNAMFYEDESPWAGAVFCEDRSEFEVGDADGPGGPREFVAEVEGEWSRRHVAVLDDWMYTPKSRFAV